MRKVENTSIVKSNGMVEFYLQTLSWSPHGESGWVLDLYCLTSFFFYWRCLSYFANDFTSKFSDCRWWLSWEWYVWLSSSSSSVRHCKTQKYMYRHKQVQFYILIYQNSLRLSSSPQSTSAPKKSCSYPSLISTPLIYKKQTNPRIDSKIIHEKSIDVYLDPISLDITPLTRPHGSPTSTTSPLDPCLYLSCECVAPVSFLGTLGFSNLPWLRTKHPWWRDNRKGNNNWR